MLLYLKFPHLLSSQFEAYVDEDPVIDRFNSHRIVLSINWQASRMLQGQLLWIYSPAVFCFPSEALYAEPTFCLHSIFRPQGHHSVICLGFQHQKKLQLHPKTQYKGILRSWYYRGTKLHNSKYNNIKSKFVVSCLYMRSLQLFGKEKASLHYCFGAIFAVSETADWDHYYWIF